MDTRMNRRHLLSGIGMAGGAYLGSLRVSAALTAPAPPVAVAKSKTYGPELLSQLAGMFDQLGGLGRIVKGKTVTIKLCLNGRPDWRLGHLNTGNTHWPHPRMIAATLHLMDRAGARRIRLVESPAGSMTEPLEDHLYQANWDPTLFTSAAKTVEFVNTNSSGRGKKYSRFTVPHGGVVFGAYDLHQIYEQCDVFVSIAKLKDHPTTGVTLGMKNVFGTTPSMAYNNRMAVLHLGKRQPDEGAPAEKDSTSPREDGYRIPRVLAELVAARPVHLTLIDGVRTLIGAQRPETFTVPANPGVLLAGTNVVTTDAVAMAVMNYNPAGERGQTPFETCDNKLRMAEALGVGTPDLSRIEVLGTPVRDAMFDYKAYRKRRAASSS